MAMMTVTAMSKTTETMKTKISLRSIPRIRMMIRIRMQMKKNRISIRMREKKKTLLRGLTSAGVNPGRWLLWIPDRETWVITISIDISIILPKPFVDDMKPNFVSILFLHVYNIQNIGILYFRRVWHIAHWYSTFFIFLAYQIIE